MPKYTTLVLAFLALCAPTFTHGRVVQRTAIAIEVLPNTLSIPPSYPSVFPHNHTPEEHLPPRAHTQVLANKVIVNISFYGSALQYRAHPNSAPWPEVDIRIDERQVLWGGRVAVWNVDGLSEGEVHFMQATFTFAEPLDLERSGGIQLGKFIVSSVRRRPLYASTLVLPLVSATLDWLTTPVHVPTTWPYTWLTRYVVNPIITQSHEAAARGQLVKGNTKATVQEIVSPVMFVQRVMAASPLSGQMF